MKNLQSALKNAPKIMFFCMKLRIVLMSVAELDTDAERAVFAQIPRTCPQVEELSIIFGRGVSRSPLNQKAHFGRNVRTAIPFAGAFWKALSDNCPKLQGLIVSEVPEDHLKGPMLSRVKYFDILSFHSDHVLFVCRPLCVDNSPWIEDRRSHICIQPSDSPLEPPAKSPTHFSVDFLDETGERKGFDQIT